MATAKLFPEEIMTEILVRLPVKSILRCRSLSKHYYLLIRSPFFIRKHLLGPAKKGDNHSLLYPRSGILQLIDRTGCTTALNRKSGSDIYFDGSKHMVCEPVDGLYCIVNSKTVISGRGIILRNLATREDFLLPSIPKPSLTGVCAQLHVACGFGYDDNTNNYKVVIFYGFCEMFYGTDFSCDAITSSWIFNMNEGSWRNLEQYDDLDPWKIRSGAGLFVSGACHWLYAPLLGTSSMNDLGCEILAFDVSTEMHSYISFPSVPDKVAWSSASIVSINGCLAVINLPGGDSKENTPSFNVWVMQVYGDTESWKMLYHVVLESGLGCRYLGLIKDRIYIGEDGALVSYDLVSKKRECYSMPDKDVLWIVSFVKSLVHITPPRLDRSIIDA